MSERFPSSAELLEMVTADESHSLEGQQRKARWIVDFVNRWGLGRATLHPFPAGSPRAKDGLFNVTIDVGEGSDERLLGLVHLDTVPPHPLQERRWRNDDEFAARGSSDMLGGLVAFLLALKDIVVNSRRSIRVLITCLEEQASEGVLAAVHPTNNLAAGASALLTVDVSSVGNMKDRPMLFIGGQGRVGMRWSASAPETHGAALVPNAVATLLSHREAAARLAVETLAFPEHPDDRANILPKSFAVVRDWHSGHSAGLPTSAHFDMEVYYGNPTLSAQDVIERVRKGIAQSTGDNQCTLTPEDRGGAPFVGPWLTGHVHPLVANAKRLAEQAVGGPVGLGGYRGSGDAEVVLRTQNIPGIGFPPCGEGLHGPNECVSRKSVEQVAAFIRLLAAYDGLLTRPLAD